MYSPTGSYNENLETILNLSNSSSTPTQSSPFNQQLPSIYPPFYNDSTQKNWVGRSPQSSSNSPNNHNNVIIKSSLDNR